MKYKPTILAIAVLLIVMTLYPISALSVQQVPVSGNNGAITGNAPSQPTTVTLGTILFDNLGDTSAGFVAAGIGMRNVGHGTITMRLPIGATLGGNAWLIWAVMGPSTPVASALENVATVNGERVVGTLAGSAASPCWLPTTIRVYYANIASTYSRTGGPVYVFEIGGFASSLKNGEDPWPAIQPSASAAATPQSAPMMEGATIVAIFTSPNLPVRNVKLYVGATTVLGGTSAFTATHTAKVAGNPAEITAIIADGQSASVTPFSKSYSITTSVGTTTLQTTDPISGKDPSLQSYAQFKGSLWDTWNNEVGSIIPAADTSHTITLVQSTDCVTWAGYVLAV